MPQGKLKVKTKLPTVKAKSNKGKAKKGPAIQKRRGNAPVQSKKARLQETQKLKKIISKTVNTAMEDDLRERAFEGRKTLTKKEPKSKK